MYKQTQKLRIMKASDKLNQTIGQLTALTEKLESKLDSQDAIALHRIAGDLTSTLKAVGEAEHEMEMTVRNIQNVLSNMQSK